MKEEEKSTSRRCLQELRERRERIITGKLNCIPLPFSRFRDIFPGLEKNKYVLITASQKVGKSKFADFTFVYDPFFYMMEHPNQLKVKVLYFPLETSKKDKLIEFYCHLLYKLSGGTIRVSPTDLKSTNKDKPINQGILDLLETEEYQKYIKAFEDCVIFEDNIKNPTGINKFCRQYALDNGTLIKKKLTIKDEAGLEKEIDIVDRYVPNDPEEYRIIILDNAANISTESGMSLTESITKLSKYFIILRDQLGYTPVLIQHQAQAQEGLENFKLNKIKPSPSGLADCKTTIRDVNLALGLYSPYKYEYTEYEKYDITVWKNNIRFLEIMEDRDNGGGGSICPLYFDGATSYFKELPLPHDIVEIRRAYSFLEAMRNSTSSSVFFSYTINKINNKFLKLINGNYRSNFRIKWRWKDYFNNHKS